MAFAPFVLLERRPRNILCEIRGFYILDACSIGLTEFHYFTLVFVWNRRSKSIRIHYPKLETVSFIVCKYNGINLN